MLGWGVVAAVLVGSVVGLIALRDDGSSSAASKAPAPIAPRIRLGDMLFGRKNHGFPEPGGLLRSIDGGRTWSEVRLPRQPEKLHFVVVGRRGPVVYAAASHDTEAPLGARPTNDRLVWTTTDGERWHGPLVMERTAGVGAPHVGRVGKLLVTGATMEGSLFVFTSADAGRSWQRRPVDGLRLAPEEEASLQQSWLAEDGTPRATAHFSGLVNPEHDLRQALLMSPDGGTTWKVAQLCRMAEKTGPCNVVIRSGGVLLRGLELSRDGGATWVRPVFKGSFEHALAFTSMAKLPGGGRLATVDGYVFAGGGPVAWVVRSDDGVQWVPLLGPGIDGCPAEPADTDQPVNRVSIPKRSNGGWSVVYTCPTRGVGRYVADEDARSFRLVERMD